MQTNPDIFQNNQGFGQNDCLNGVLVFIVDLSESIISEDNISVVF